MWHKIKFKAIKLEVNNRRENVPLEASNVTYSSGHVTLSSSSIVVNVILKVSNCLIIITCNIWCAMITVSSCLLCSLLQFKPHGILCRASEGDCDVPEYCPGDKGDVS